MAEGAAKGDNFGAAIAVGNIDNYGEQDLVVGAPLADIATLVNSKPVVLANAGRITAFQGISDTPAYHREGTQKNARFGHAVAVGFDGRVLVGEPGYDVVTVINNKNVLLADAGRVQGFPGSNGVDEANLLMEGTVSKDFFGSALAVLPSDINGDSEIDWLTGSPRADITVYRDKPLTKKDAGKIELFSGETPVPLLTLAGSRPADRLGASVAIGDINDDGFVDLVPGAPQYDPSVLVNTRLVKLGNAGTVVAYDGSLWLP